MSAKSCSDFSSSSFRLCLSFSHCSSWSSRFELSSPPSAIEKKIFADLKDVVKITTSAKTPDPDQLRRINEVVDRLVKEHGYCPVCANELLTYVGTLLSR